MSYTPLVDVLGAWKILETVTVSNQATVDLDLTGTHETYMLRLIDIIPATDNQELFLRMSLVGSSTFISGASDYAYRGDGGTTGSGYNIASASASEIALTRPGTGNRMGFDPGESLNAVVIVYNRGQNSADIAIKADVTLRDSGGTFGGHVLHGILKAASATDDVDAIRLLAASGNLNSGSVVLYGSN